MMMCVNLEVYIMCKLEDLLTLMMDLLEARSRDPYIRMSWNLDPTMPVTCLTIENVKIEL